MKRNSEKHLRRLINMKSLNDIKVFNQLEVKTLMNFPILITLKNCTNPIAISKTHQSD